MKLSLKLLFITILFLQTLCANTDVSLQLAWKHQFQFAGYYMAKEKGFYTDAGLNVKIKEYDNGVEITDDVVSNKVDFGVGRSSLIRDRDDKKPVVMLAAIFQHSPVILLTKKRDDITKLEDLIDKKIMLTTDQVSLASINAMLQSHQITPDMYTTITHSFNVQDLIDGKTDAILSYISNEPYSLEQANIEYTTFAPKDYSFDFYSDILFTSEEYIQKNPVVVKDFRLASLKGWKYALEHQEEAVEIILKKYNTQNKTKDALLYEANAISKLVSQNEIELGNIDPKRVIYIKQIYSLMGLISGHKSIDGLIYDVKKYENNINFTKQEIEWLKAHPVIKVANETDYAPWDFTQNSKPVGYSIDYIKQLAKKAGIKINFVTDTWENLIKKTKNGEIDLIHTMYKNNMHDNLEFVIPYKKVIIGLYVNSSDNTIKTIYDLSGKKISVTEGDSIVNGIEKTVKDVTFINRKGYVELLKDVAFNKTDATVMDMAVADYLLKENTISNVKIVDEVKIKNTYIDNEYYFVTNINNPIFTSIIKKLVKNVTKDEEKVISQKWLNGNKLSNTKKVKIKFNKMEKKWLSEHKTVRFTGDPDWLPFEAFNANSNYIGIVADHLKIVEDRTGIEFERIKPKSWMNALEKVTNKEVDVISEVVVQNSTNNSLKYTNSYIETPLIVVMKKDGNNGLNNTFINSLVQIKDKKIAYVTGYGYVDELKEKYKKIQFNQVSTVKEGLEKVASGELDAMVCTLTIGSFNMSKLGLSNLAIVGKLDIVMKLGFGVRKDWPLLVSILNKTLASITEEERSEITNKWVKVTIEEEVNWTLILKIVGIFIIVFIFILYYNRKLKKLVNEKTIELQSSLDSFDKNVIASSTDKYGVIDYVSEAICKISNYSQEELLGKSHNILRHPDMEKETFIDLWVTITNNNVWNGEIKNRKKDGGYYWVEAIISPKLNQKGELIGFSSISQDITSKKEVEELNLQQTFHMTEIERSNRLLNGRETMMVELKTQINQYKQKLGEELSYNIVDTSNLNIQEETIIDEKVTDLKILLDTEQLQVLMENFYKIMHIPLAIIDLKGDVLVQSKWQRACTDFHRANEESCKRCISSDIELGSKLNEGENFTSYKCQNGLIDCASPIIVNGEHVANFFIGQFMINEPDMEYFKKQAKLFSYDKEEYLESIKEVTIIKEDMLPNILGFLVCITDMVSTMSLKSLDAEQNSKISMIRENEMKKGQIAALNLAEDAEKARLEIENYKEHLESLVEERTEELHEQKEFVQILLDSQDQIIITTDGIELLSGNESFFIFFDVDTVDTFIQNYEVKCICDLFNNDAPEGYLQKMMDDEKWIDYVISRKDSAITHKVMITRGDDDYIFSVTATNLPGDKGLKSAVFTDITAMEVAKQEIEQILANILLPVLITSKKDRKILYANKYAEIQYEKSIDEIIGSDVDSIYTVCGEHYHIIEAIKKYGRVENMEETFITSTGKEFTALLSVTPIRYQDTEAYIGMVADITKQKEMEYEVREIHKHTRDSIEYASHIQGALIPDDQIFKNFFQDHFAIWQPKDIVGGDIYLMNEINENELILMVIDCTGHGVPGAFVTMLVKAIERQLMANIYQDETISPAKILSIFNCSIKNLLKQEDNDSISNAGFDGGIIYYNKKEKIVKFSGAETSLFYINENNELLTIKGSRHSIGYKKSDANFEFKEHIINVKEGMQFYCTTDGYLDQNGGEKTFPFGKKKFCKIIEDNHMLSFNKQKEILLSDMKEYQGEEERNDDITMIGIKI